MVHEPVLECSFFIPIRRDSNLSDGKPHKQACWRWMDRQLYVLFEGATIAPDLYEGFYRDADMGKRVGDKSRRFITAIPESRVDELRSLLSVAGRVFQQKCIYLSVAGHVEFVEASEHDSS